MATRVMWLLGALGFLTCAAALGVPPDADKKAEPETKPAGFAVVELFTSEGCSSCPPADAVLAKIAREAKENNQRVICLAMHVDYWDYLGWKDRFASKEISDRQRGYAESPAKPGDKGGVYTPQMIVNGRDRFVGSDEKQARTSIESSLKERPTANVEPTISPRKAGETIHISAKASGQDLDFPKQDKTLRGTTILAALVEDGLSTVVKKGENGGRTLKHDRVVRTFVSKPLDAPAKSEANYEVVQQLDLKVPEGVDERRCSVVVLVQRPGSTGVVGAAEIPLPKPESAESAKPPASSNPVQSPNPTRK